jgi:2-dehydropantoate 2-reductase
MGEARPRRYVVIGAGAIGCATAALLTESGQAVVLVARGEALAAVRQGVDVRTPTGSRRVHVPAATCIEDVGPTSCDLVVLAVMGQHTESAIAGVARDVPVLSFQNGTVPLEILAARGHPTFAGMLYLPVERRGPGVIALVGAPWPGTILVGPWGSAPPWSDAIATALTEGGFRAEAEPDMAPWIYSKLLQNLGGIALALCDTPPRDLIEAAQAEAIAVFAASGARWVDQPVFAARMGALRVVPVDGRERVGGSTRGALARGEPLETAVLHGGIVAAGLRHGVPTPVNAGLIAAAERATREQLAPGGLDSDVLWAWVRG